jgi:CubicO group peptidase (beta-lactamase class C family)
VIASALTTVGLFLGISAGLSGGADRVFPGEDWEAAKPESQGVDSARLADAVAYLKANSGSDGVRELLVIRNGRILWQGEAIDKVHGIWSCTKSFTSTILGLLVDARKCSLDTKAASVIPELAGTFPDITLKHLTTMTSGYRADGDEPKGGYTHGPSSTPFRPDSKPLFSPPGSQYAYWDSAMHLLGLALTRIAGESMQDIFRRQIAERIGMDPTRWRWGSFPADRGIAVNSGASGVEIPARDLARLGHLYLNNGKWNGRQVISARWVRLATSIQTPASLPLGHKQSGIDGRGCYGFNWWVNGFRPDGGRLWPGAPPSTFAAVGFNNNKLIVVPPWQMVIVRLGLDEGDKKITDEAIGEFLRLIGQSLNIRERSP